MKHYEQKELTPEQSTWYMEHPHANVRPLLASVWELLTRVTGGPNSSELLAKLGPDGSWLKMYLGSCQLMLDGSMETYSGPWPKRGILSAGNVGALPMLERRTKESAYSLWATPVTGENRNSRSAITGKSKNGTINTRKSELLLAQEIELVMGIIPKEIERWEELPKKYAGLWPSPAVIDANKSLEHHPRKDATLNRSITLSQIVHMWPTPAASDYRSGLPENSKRIERKKAQGRSQNLKDVVLWPTPTTPRPHDTDATAGKCIASQNQKDLTYAAAKGGGQLNPNWVETLQGYPQGWTRLPEDWKPKTGKRAKARNNTRGNPQE